MTTTSMTWNRLKNLVKNRDKAICYHCKKVASNGHCDHLIPLSKGGTDAIDNLVWSCEKCNLTKSNKIIEPNILQPIAPDNPLFEKAVSSLMPSRDAVPSFNNILTSLYTLAIEMMISPYPRYSTVMFWDWRHYCEVITDMRKRKIATWIRDRIWPISSGYRDFLYQLDEASISNEMSLKNALWSKWRYPSCPVEGCGKGAIIKISETKRSCPAGHTIKITPDPDALYSDYVIESIWPEKGKISYQ